MRKDRKEVIKDTQDAIKAILTPFGFKGPRGQYYCDLGTGLLMIGYYGSGSGAEHFTLNIGFGVHSLYEKYDDPQQAKTRRVYNCHYVNRIGWFNFHLAETPLTIEVNGAHYPHSDPWWTIDPDTPLAKRTEILSEIRYLLEEVVLKETLKWSDISQFIEHIKPSYDEDADFVYNALTSQKNVPPPDIRWVG